MSKYRSRRFGKIYKAVEDPYTHLGIIMVRDESYPDGYARCYSIGPYGALEVAEKVLRDRAEYCDWEEIQDD